MVPAAERKRLVIFFRAWAALLEVHHFRGTTFETDRPDLRFLNSDRPGLMVADPAAAG